jgi:hypothetical protein
LSLSHATSSDIALPFIGFELYPPTAARYSL